MRYGRVSRPELLVPSAADFDARLVDRSRIQIANGAGTKQPLQVRSVDADCDGRADVLAVFSVHDARLLMEYAGGEPLALRYETLDGVGYLVSDIFQLGLPASISVKCGGEVNKPSTDAARTLLRIAPR
jgi:hypothetical protein